MTGTGAHEAESRKASMMLRGGDILTLDSNATVLEATDLSVVEGRIGDIGRGLEIRHESEVLDVEGCWVLPGLVQGHVHLGQTLFRGLAEGRRLLPWLRERIWPLEAAHTDESAYWSGLLGAAECLMSGTSTIQEIGLGPGAAGLPRGDNGVGTTGPGGYVSHGLRRRDAGGTVRRHRRGSDLDRCPR